MKAKTFLTLLILGAGIATSSLLSSCNNYSDLGESSSNPYQLAAETKAQALLTDILCETSETRSGTPKVHVSFFDALSEENYEYDLIIESDSCFHIDLDLNGSSDFDIVGSGNDFIGTINGEASHVHVNQQLLSNGMYLYSLGCQDFTRRDYHMSYWECCCTLLATKEFCAAAYIAGAGPIVAASAVICLNDNMRWTQKD